MILHGKVIRGAEDQMFIQLCTCHSNSFVSITFISILHIVQSLFGGLLGLVRGIRVVQGTDVMSVTIDCHRAGKHTPSILQRHCSGSYPPTWSCRHLRCRTPSPEPLWSAAWPHPRRLILISTRLLIQFERDILGLLIVALWPPATLPGFAILNICV